MTLLRLQVEADTQPGILSRIIGLVERPGAIPRTLTMDHRDDKMLIAVEIDGWCERRSLTLIYRIEGIVGVRTCSVSIDPE